MRSEGNQPLQPSVLDRLLDEAPETEREPARMRGQRTSELHASVRRDLENLLNTRWFARSWPGNLSEIGKSVVGYGIPDVAAANLGAAEGRNRFLELVERAITMFEPRFVKVRVVPLENVDSLDRTLRFRIEAMLHASPAPEPVVYDSVLDRSTGNCEVRSPDRDA